MLLTKIFSGSRAILFPFYLARINASRSIHNSGKCNITKLSASTATAYISIKDQAKIRNKNMKKYPKCIQFVAKALWNLESAAWHQMMVHVPIYTNSCVFNSWGRGGQACSLLHNYNTLAWFNILLQFVTVHGEKKCITNEPIKRHCVTRIMPSLALH